MTTFVDWPASIPVLQILLAATGVMVAAAWLSRYVPRRRAVAQEWLWRGALFGVLVSPLVPLLNHFAPMIVPALAILPSARGASNELSHAMRSEVIAMPVSFQTTPSLVQQTPAHTPAAPGANTHAAAAHRAGSADAVGPGAPVQSPGLVVNSSERRTASLREVASAPTNAAAARLSPHAWVFGILAVVWLAGVIYHLARGWVGRRLCQRIVAAAIPLDHPEYDHVLANLQRALRLAALPPITATSRVGSPAVFGTWRPHIVLPVAALEWMSSSQLFQVLLHEAAHVVRRDPLVNSLQALARALYWPHPLVHWLSGRLSQAREDVCDNFVLAHCPPADYAETLLQMTETCPRLAPAGGLAMLPAHGSLEERVTNLLDDRRDLSVGWPRWRKWGLASLLLLVPLLVGLVRVTDRAARAEEPKKKSVTPNETAPQELKRNEKSAPTDTSSKNIETGAGRISGQVLFDAGERVAAGATVILLLPPPKGQNEYYGLLPLRETTADSQGKFSFVELAPGKYRVWANLDKQTSRVKARQGATVTIQENGEQPQSVALRLRDGVAVSVRVNDKSTGKSIPNSTVHLGWSDLIGDFHAAGSRPVAVQPLTPERWFFEVWAEGYAKESRWLNLENGKDADVEFQLGPGGDLEGIVRDPAGKAVPGVGLSVSADGGLQQIDWIETDAQGHYRLEHLPLAGGLTISVSKIDWARQELAVRLTRALQKQDVTLSPRPHGGSIAGVVEDDDGNPIAGALLINTGMSTSEIRETTSDNAGRFKLENLYRGSIGTEVMVRAKKFAPMRFGVEPGPAAKPAEMTIVMEAGHRIAGRVADDAGRPLAGVTVYFANGNLGFSNGGKGTTDKLGRFEFDSLPAECPFTFSKEGFSQIDGRMLPLDSDEVVSIEMIPSGVIDGTVIDRVTKKPVQAFNVRITFSPQRRPDEPGSGLRSDLVNPGQAFQSEKGKFRLTELVAGMPLQVMIDAAGYERTTLERVVATRSDEADEVQFELERVDPATVRNYSGQVLNARGTPVVGAQLRLFAARDRQRVPRRAQFPFNWQMIRTGQLAQQAQVLRFVEAATDKDGRFTFTGIPRNLEVELAWWGNDIAAGRADHLEEFEDGEALKIEITLPAPARLKGTIDRKQFPRAGRIEIHSHDETLEGTGLALKPDQKEFEIANLAPGQYSVTLMSPLERAPGGGEGALTNHRLATVTIAVGEGEVEQVDFTEDNAVSAEPPPRKTPPLK